MMANTTPTNDTFVLLRLADALVEQIFKADVPYKKAGILLTHFSPETLVQPSMYVDELRDKTDNLMPVIDAINKRSGKGSVLLGTRLQTNKWQASKEAQSPAYTTNWTEIATVKA